MSTTVTVTGSYYNPDHTPASGLVRFTPTSDWCNGEHIVASTVVAPIVSGLVTAQLISPDCAGTVPTGVTYRVDESVGGLPVATYYIDVPCGVPSLDLCSVPHGVTPPAVGFYEVLGHKDQPGGYAGLDAGGKLAPGELPAAVVPPQASSGSAYTVPATSQGGILRLLLTASPVALTLPAAVAGSSFRLVLTQDGTGNRTVTWPTVSPLAKWPGGTAPTLATAANAVDVITFLCVDGISWYGVAFAGNVR